MIVSQYLQYRGAGRGGAGCKYCQSASGGILRPDWAWVGLVLCYAQSQSQSQGQSVVSWEALSHQHCAARLPLRSPPGL